MYKFGGFTQKANEAVNSAITYAGKMGHTYVGSVDLSRNVQSKVYPKSNISVKVP